MSIEEVAAELRKRQGPVMDIGCAVDGSSISDLALGASLVLTNTNRGDRFVVLHIADSKKDYLPKHLQPSHLKHVYVDRASASAVQAEWLCREKEEGRSTCESLTRLADKSSLDLLVIGSWGRKGEKLDVLGGVADFSLRQSHCSVCIVRSTGPGWGRALKYLFATDGSHAAHLAFCTLTGYLMRPTDSVHVVMVTSKDGTEEQRVVEPYRQYMAQHKISGEVSVKCIGRGSTTLPEGIISAVDELGCGALCLGISGYGKKKLGSVSEEISARAHCTTLIIKDHKEVVGAGIGMGRGAA